MFAAIWLTARGIRFSSPKFRALLGVAQSTALVIIKKVAIVLERKLEQVYALLPASLFASVVNKRSRESSSRKHPRADLENLVLDEEMQNQVGGDFQSHEWTTPDVCKSESEFQPTSENRLDSEQVQPGDMHSADPKPTQGVNTDVDESSELEANILSLLHEGKSLHFDEICIRVNAPVGAVAATLTVLEIANSLERLSGDWYKAKRPPPSQSAGASKGDSTVPGASEIALMKVIAETHHGVSGKYLQNYLSLASYVQQKTNKESMDSLLFDCISYGKISYAAIMNYLSSRYIKCFSTD